MPGNLRRDIVNRQVKSAGTTFWRTFTVLSSDMTTAQQALSTAATGDLAVVACVLQTDATGLAGATNFEIGVSGETYGLDKPIVEAVSNLGASAHRSVPAGSIAADTTNDNHITVTAAVPFILQAGDSLQYSGSSSAGTGAGIILIAIKFERLADNANVDAVV